MSHHENGASVGIVPERAKGCLVATPLGRDLFIASDGLAIVESRFVARRRGPRSQPSDVLLLEASAQVRAYFERRLSRFDLPLQLAGTPLQIAAWQAAASLSFGEFASYADIAAAIGRPGAHRGVASAMAATAIDLFVPAHRVIGADGRVKGANPGSVRLRLVLFERGHPARGSP